MAASSKAILSEQYTDNRMPRYPAVSCEHAVEIGFDISLLLTIDHVADDLWQLLDSVVIFQFVMEDAQQFTAAIMQRDRSAVFQLIADRENLSIKAAEIAVKSG